MRKRRTIGRWSWGVVLAGCLLAAMPAGGQEPGSASGISDAQRQQIETATEPARLLQLAQDFALHRQYEPARLCIAKACEANNDLWTDTTRQSPRSWNEFWFACRAELREAKLAEEDAAGRTALAVWLYEAGVQRPARQILRRALEIDPLNRQARELAQAWNLFGGQPLRFDLSYALTHPLLLDSVTDEDEVVTAEAGEPIHASALRL